MNSLTQAHLTACDAHANSARTTPVAALNIQRTTHPTPPPIQHMGVNLGRRHILMAQQFLNGANVIPCFQQMRGK